MSCGHDSPPETMDNKLTLAATRMFDGILKDLDVEYLQHGTLCVALNESEIGGLRKQRKIAVANGIYDVVDVTREWCLNHNPSLNPEVKAGLYIPGERIVDVMELMLAYIENAMDNGVRIMLGTEALKINTDSEKQYVTSVTTNRGEIETKFVINCAAINADKLGQSVGLCDYVNYPRYGQYYVMDKDLPYKPYHTIIPLPSPISRGRLVTPTVHGNMLIGPSADNGWDREDRSTTKETLESVLASCRKLIPAIDPKDSIRQFKGVRPAKRPNNWQVRAHPAIKGYIEAVGISQGVSAGPGVGVYVRELLDDEGLKLEVKDDYQPKRVSIRRFRDMTDKERAEAIREDPRYGNVICRCETVTEAEIIQAIHKGPGSRSVDSIKRRLRPGMGRCQGGFCSPRIVEILSRELGVSPTQIRLNEPGSEIVLRQNKGYESGGENDG